ncbi:MAG: protein kinase [Acidobacteriia bacterium]|nr:protein kinase [Terriglobia bacterium]
MTPEQFRLIDELYNAARERSAEDRAALLARADPELRREVESLLAQPSGDMLLDRPAIEAVPALLEDATVAVLSTGTRFGPYRIEAKLGEGGMGDVYLAEDQRLGRRVALKLPKGAGGELLREAQLAARLDHPNICQVYEAGEHQGRPYIAMQYVEGETLAHRLSRGRLTEAEVITIAGQAAEGLAEAHRRGVLHRDIKPANIMLGVRGQVKVMDFGLAVRGAGRATGTSTTQTIDMAAGQIAGTLRYMSPEQLRGEPLDVRADIFSFGAVLYEMFTGRRAFAAELQGELMAAILSTNPPVEEVPQPHRALVANCLAKSRQARPASMQEVLAGLASETRAPSAPSRRALSAGIAAAALIAVGIFAWRRFAAPAEIHSLAILGLENRSGDASQDYFADGLTNALAAGLGRLNGLRVIPPAATLIYRGIKKPLSEIGKELNADVLLDGTVSRAGNRLAIRTRLASARGGRDLWTHTYDSTAAELPASQNQIERDIAAQVHASAPDRARMIDTRKLDPRAYDLYLRAGYHASRLLNAQDTDQAIELYEQAAAIAPDFAPLQADLASAYAAKSFSYAPDDRQLEDRSFAAIEKAFALDPDSAEAHVARGQLLWRPSHKFPHREALTEYRLAAAARPNLDTAFWGMAGILIHVGHLDEALVELRKAAALNPSHPSAASRVSEVHLFQGKPQLFLDELKRNPLAANVSIMQFNHAWALIDLSRLDEAARSIRSDFQDVKGGASGLKHSVSALLAARQSNRRLAESEIRAAIAEEHGFAHFHHIMFMIACAYSVMGDVDRAQEWMEKTAEDGFPCYTLFEVEPSLERWRATPRGREFLVNLRREWETTT